MNSTEHSQAAALPAEPPRRSRWPKIIGFVSAGIVFLLIAAIVIPCLVSGISAANESGAIGSLRIICNAQLEFSRQQPEKGFAATLAELGLSPGGNQIDPALASGAKYDYIFTITPGTSDSSGVITKYTVTASPQKLGKTGMRNFFMDESGVIRYTVENRRASASDPALQ